MRLRSYQASLAVFLALGAAVTALVFVMVEAGLQRALGAIYGERVAAQVERAAELVRFAEGADPTSLAEAIRGTVEVRVSIIDTAGVVLGDSHVPADVLHEVDNHLDRPEVRAALTGGGSGVATDERSSSTVSGEAFLYGATLSELAGEPVVVRVATPLDEIARTVGSVRVSVMWACLLAILALTGPVALMSHALARPLNNLAERVSRLGEGEYSRVRRTRIVELDRLGVSFNRLAGQLRARVSELERERLETEALIDGAAEGVVIVSADGKVGRTNLAARRMLDLPEMDDSEGGGLFGGLVRQPELRAAVEDALALGTTEESRRLESAGISPVPLEIEVGGRAIAVTGRPAPGGGVLMTLLDVSELRRTEAVRRDFVANASHELRTPLTAIRGFVETLVEGDPPEPERRKFLRYVQENTTRLQRLVEDLLDLSRLEAGGWIALREKVEVAAAAREAWTLVESQWSAKKVVCSFSGDAAVAGDRAALVNVFRNLLENSARHVDDGGRIRVRVVSDRVGGMTTVEVIDDGEGIQANVLGRVFERFFRADSSRARDLGGTGLGLAIVRHIVNAMEGAVEAESELGKGTTIRFTLPAWENAE